MDYSSKAHILRDIHNTHQYMFEVVGTCLCLTVKTTLAPQQSTHPTPAVCYAHGAQVCCALTECALVCSDTA